MPVFDPQDCIRTVTYLGREKVIIRPGISLILYSDTPVGVLGPAVADAIEAYLAFIPEGSLETYLGDDGHNKELQSNTISKKLKTFRGVRPQDEFWEVHFGQGSPGSVGTHALHFQGSHLKNRTLPLEACELRMEWPMDLFQTLEVRTFMDFVIGILDRYPCVSGSAGLALQRSNSFRRQGEEAAGPLMKRFLAIEPGFDGCRDEMRGGSPCAHWMNYIRRDLGDKLGGEAAIRGALPAGVEVKTLKHGFLIIGAKEPPAGDRESGATDLGWLPDVARVLKPVRFTTTGFGFTDVDLDWWHSRFDQLKSPGVGGDKGTK